MTQAPPRAPTYLQPRAKASPTSTTSSASTLAPSAPGSAAPVPPPRSRQLHPRPSASSSSSASASAAAEAALTKSATTAFIRRTLCAHRPNAATAPLDELLPPLTSSNEVDLQLYAVIAVVVRDYVLQWYSKITPDREFVDEVLRVVAHCTRAIEERLRKVNLDELDDSNSLEAYRLAFVQQPRALPLRSSRELYSALRPHPALCPIPDTPANAETQRANEAAYRHVLVQKALSLLLPSEELQNDCLRALVGEIFSELILGNVVNRFSQSWAWWDAIDKSIQALPMTGSTARLPAGSETKMTGRDSNGLERRHRSLRWSISNLLGRLVAVVVVVYSSIAMVFRAFAGASSSRHAPLGLTIVDIHAFSLLNSALQLSMRVPWLVSPVQWTAQALVYGPGKVGAVNGSLNRTLVSILRSSVLTPTHLPHLLHTFRRALFPSNHLVPSSPAPSAPSTRRLCAQRIATLLPRQAWLVLFHLPSTQAAGEDPVLDALEREVLNVWEDEHANRGLAYALLERVVLEVLPELGEG
ncbi:MAG: hypothetical protein M1814_006233 [Vezdaea aestivalis]|nr:MAG: hypothetical protein M1814_006233 [Vezdaea aestivalis]